MTIRKAAAIVVASSAVLVAAGTAHAQSAVQFTKDGKRTLISKDIGNERWAISYDLEDLTVTGNVFFPGGGDPKFVWCERSKTPSVEPGVALDCHGADKCSAGPCPSGQWAPLAHVTLPVEFFFPPGAISPLAIYVEGGSEQNRFIPSGFMGDHAAITLDDRSSTQPHSGMTSAKFRYSGERTQGNGWAGVYWQFPENNFGAQPGRTDVAPRERLSFWVRGEAGGERLRFGSGGVKGHGSFQDSYDTVCAGPCGASGTIVLSTEWQHHVINLRDHDLGMVIGAFFWVTSADENPNGATFFLDDIFFE